MKLWIEAATPVVHEQLYYSSDGENFVTMEEAFPDGVKYECNNWSLEENLIPDFESNIPVGIAPKLKILYTDDTQEQIKTLKTEKASLTDLDNALDALCTAMGYTYDETKRTQDSDGNWVWGTGAFTHN